MHSTAERVSICQLPWRCPCLPCLEMSPLLSLSGRLLFVPEEERDLHAATLEALIHKCKANVPEYIVRDAWGKLPEEREGERLTENTQPQ